MHGSIGASSTTITSNHVVAIASNFTIVASDSIEIQLQQLATIQAQATTWKPHTQTSLCWGF